jgi:hypothetical protein
MMRFSDTGNESRSPNDAYTPGGMGLSQYAGTLLENPPVAPARPQEPPHLDIPPLPSGGACSKDDPCLRFRPHGNGSAEFNRERHSQLKKPVEPDADGKYTVKPGDILEDIAKRIALHDGKHQSPAAIRKRSHDYYQGILDCNKNDNPKLLCNPEYLKPGMKLDIPKIGGDVGQPPPSLSVAGHDGAPPVAGHDGAPLPFNGKGFLDTIPDDSCRVNDGTALEGELSTHSSGLTSDQLKSAEGILSGLSSGDKNAVEGALRDCKDDQTAVDRIAESLRETLKPYGISVSTGKDYDQANKKSVPALYLHVLGTDNAMEYTSAGSVAILVSDHQKVTYLMNPLPGRTPESIKDIQKALQACAKN